MITMRKVKDIKGKNAALKEEKVKKIEMSCQKKKRSNTSKRKGGEVKQKVMVSVKKKKHQRSTCCK